MKIILTLFILIGLLFSNAFLIKAQEETTFPVDEAGISAYVRLDNITINDLTEALNYLSGDIRRGENYIIGQVYVPNELNSGANPYIYLGLDGWLVAYYPKTEEASKIMQWKNYISGSIITTTLKDALDIFCANMGENYSLSAIKYYDFEFPDANKMVLIVETATGGWNNFSITVPGTVYEASYSGIGNSNYRCYWMVCSDGIYLKVDGNVIITSINENKVNYGYYGDYFAPDIPHYVELYDGFEIPTSIATVIIYGN